MTDNISPPSGQEDDAYLGSWLDAIGDNERAGMFEVEENNAGNTPGKNDTEPYDAIDEFTQEDKKFHVKQSPSNEVGEPQAVDTSELQEDAGGVVVWPPRGTEAIDEWERMFTSYMVDDKNDNEDEAPSSDELPENEESLDDLPLEIEDTHGVDTDIEDLGVDSIGVEDNNGTEGSSDSPPEEEQNVYAWEFFYREIDNKNADTKSSKGGFFGRGDEDLLSEENNDEEALHGIYSKEEVTNDNEGKDDDYPLEEGLEDLADDIDEPQEELEDYGNSVEEELDVTESENGNGMEDVFDFFKVDTVPAKPYAEDDYYQQTEEEEDAAFISDEDEAPQEEELQWDDLSDDLMVEDEEAETTFDVVSEGETLSEEEKDIMSSWIDDVENDETVLEASEGSDGQTDAGGMKVAQGGSQGRSEGVNSGGYEPSWKKPNLRESSAIKPTLIDSGPRLPVGKKHVKTKRKEDGEDSTRKANKKRYERKGFRLKDTDKELIDIASRYRYITTRTASRYLDASHDTARRRMRKLKEVGLFASKAIGPHQTLWLPTPSGLELINSPYKAIEKHTIGHAHLAHETGVLHLGVELETAYSNPLGESLTIQYKHPDLRNPGQPKVRGNNTITVKQIRSSQYWWQQKYGSQDNIIAKIEEAKIQWGRNPNQQTPELHPDNAVMWITYDEKAHIPDLVLARDRNADGSPASIAIELELSEKQPAEWERILRSFKNSWQYDKLYYLTPYEKIAKKLKRINETKVGIPSHKFVILRYMTTNGTPSGYQPFQI